MFCLCTSSRLSFFLERWKSRQPPASFVFGLQGIGVARRQIPCYVNINSTQAYSHDYDPSKELLGLEVDPQSRNLIPSVPKAKSWFGPNGQYIRELPCPCCRGRGYTPCPECGVDRSRSDCSQCNGKGVKTCWQCLGECVIWEESYDERPWEKARSSSLFKVKEDDEVDSLEIKTEDTRPSKRVYQTPSREVSLKISRTLRSLNAKTGLFSKRMKIIHQDPVLHAQRVAAIKISKGTPAARKRASDISKAYFSNPENRLKRSLAMKGVKFYCSHCGEEGHRRHYCAALRKTSTVMRFKCSFCGEKGHNRRSCQRSTVMMNAKTIHQSTTHPQPFNFMAGSSGSEVMSTAKSKRSYFCKLCFCKGHNIRTCPNKEMPVEMHTKTAPPEQ